MKQSKAKEMSYFADVTLCVKIGALCALCVKIDNNWSQLFF